MQPLDDPTAPVPGLLSTGDADPDAGMVKGTNVPVAIAKQFIRAYEPDPRWGYTSAWGLDNKGGLTGNEPLDAYGFPQYGGAPIGNVYGGRWANDTSSAAGMYQVQPKTWQTAVEGLRNEGVNVNSFSPEHQEYVGGWLLRNRGMDDWLPYNADLKKAWTTYQRTGQMPTLQQPRQQPRAGLLAQQ